MSNSVVGKGIIDLEFSYKTALSKALSDIEKQWQKVNLASIDELKTIKDALDYEKQKTNQKKQQEKNTDLLKAQNIKLNEELRKSVGYSKNVSTYIQEMLKNNRLMTNEEKAKLQVLKSQGKEQAALAKKFSAQIDGINDTNSSLNVTNQALVSMLYSLNRIGQELYNITAEATVFQAKVESSLKVTAAIAGASDEQFELLLKNTKELGDDAPVAIDKIADSMYSLASAGLEAEEIMQALPKATKLSVGVGEDLDGVMKSLVSVVRGFNKDFDESGEILDVFANSVASSQATIAKLQTSFARLAPIAEQSNVSFEELTALLSKLYDTGLSGSRAGTVLVNTLTRLTNFTDSSTKALEESGLTIFDVSLQYNTLEESLTKVSKSIKSGALDAGDLQDIFGTRGKLITTITDEINGQADGYSNLVSEISDAAGAVDEFFSSQENTVQMALDRNANAMKRFQLLIGESNKETLTPMLNTLTSIINNLNELGESSSAVRKLISAISLSSAGLGKLLDVAVKLSSIFVGVQLAGGIGVVSASITAFATAAAPVAAIVAGVSASLYGLYAIIKDYKDIEESAKAIEEYNSSIETLNGLMGKKEETQLEDIYLTGQQVEAIELLEEKTQSQIRTIGDLIKAKQESNKLDEIANKESQLQSRQTLLQGLINQRETFVATGGRDESALAEMSDNIMFAQRAVLESQKEIEQAKNELSEIRRNDIKTDFDVNDTELDVRALVENYSKSIFDSLERQFEDSRSKELSDLLEARVSGDITSAQYDVQRSAMSESRSTDYNKFIMSQLNEILSQEGGFSRISDEITERLNKQNASQAEITEEINSAYEMFRTEIAKNIDADVNVDKETRKLKSKIELSLKDATMSVGLFSQNFEAVREYSENIQNSLAVDTDPSQEIIDRLKESLSEIGIEDSDEFISKLSTEGITLEQVLFDYMDVITEKFESESKSASDGIEKSLQEIFNSVKGALDSGIITPEQGTELLESAIKSFGKLKDANIDNADEWNKLLASLISQRETAEKEAADEQTKSAKKIKEIAQNQQELLASIAQSQAEEISRLDARNLEIRGRLQASQADPKIDMYMGASDLMLIEQLKTLAEQGDEVAADSLYNLNKAIEEMGETSDETWSTIASGISQIGSLLGSSTISGVGSIMSTGISGMESYSTFINPATSQLEQVAAGFGMAGAAISIGSTLIDMAGLGDQSAEIETLREEELEEWNEQTELLEEIQTTLESNLSSLIDYADDLVQNTTPTATNLATETSNLETIASALLTQDRDFGDLSVQWEDSMSKGLFKGSEDVDITEVFDVEDLFDIDLQNASVDELKQLSEELNNLTTSEIETLTGLTDVVDYNAEELADSIDAYIDLVETAVEEAEEFSRLATLSAFEGITAESVNKVVEELTTAYEDAGIEITDDIEAQIQQLAEDNAVQETITESVRDGFMDGFSQGLTVSESLESGVEDLFSGIFSNIGQVYYDTALDDLNNAISDFYIEYAEQLEDIKSSGGDVLDFAADYDYSSILEALVAAEEMDETMESVRDSIAEQARDLGVSEDIIDSILGEDDTTEPIVFFDESNIEKVQEMLDESTDFEIETESQTSESVISKTINVVVTADENTPDSVIKRIAEEIKSETGLENVSTSKYI